MTLSFSKFSKFFPKTFFRNLKIEWARIVCRKSNGRKIDARKSNEQKVKSNNRIWINWFIVCHSYVSANFTYVFRPSVHPWHWRFQKITMSKKFVAPCHIKKLFFVLVSVHDIVIFKIFWTFFPKFFWKSETRMGRK
jgi:hypothetical protein